MVHQRMMSAARGGPSDAERAALSAFLDWVATPPGWPVRCLLAESRKNRSKSFPPEHVDRTASSNGVLPWPFGHPDSEAGLFEALGEILPAELGIRFLQRLGNTSGMSSNVYEVEVLGAFRAAYKTCHLKSRRSPLVAERVLIPRIAAAAPRYFFEQYDVREYEAAIELIGDGGTVQGWACSADAPAPGTAPRLQWVRRCNALTLDALRLIHDAGYFHADLKPENLLLHWPASDSGGGGGGGGGGEAEAAFELKVCDWEGDNWPVTAAEIGPARCRLRDNLMLARCAAALYADLHVFSTSENLAARRKFFHWNQDMSLGLLRGWMASNPEWWGEDLPLLRAALLLDEPEQAAAVAAQQEAAASGCFDYSDGGRVGETDWSGTVASNSGDKKLIEAMGEEEAAGWVDRQERAFGELISRGGCEPALETAGRAEWRSCRADHSV